MGFIKINAMPAPWGLFASCVNVGTLLQYDELPPGFKTNKAWEEVKDDFFWKGGEKRMQDGVREKLRLPTDGRSLDFYLYFLCKGDF